MLGFLRVHQDKGFTLIEVIVSILLISLVAIGVIVFFPTSKKAIEESASKTRIANSVVSKIEELKGVGYRTLEELCKGSEIYLKLDVKNGILMMGDTEVDPSSPLYQSLDNTLKISDWQSSLSTLGVTRGIIEIKRSNIDNLLDVRVRVEWGNGRDYEIRTYISR